MIDNEPDDAVTASLSKGKHGDTVTLNYTVADIFHYNLLDFSGVAAHIASVDSAGSGTRTYTINSADSSDGVITIIAIFTHTDLEPDPIAFTNTAGHITKTYGNAAFTNAVTNAHKGSGTITYNSSDTDVAVVDSYGEVTILKAGSTTITAEKAADEVYAYAMAIYTLNINKAAGAAVSQPTVNGLPTSYTIAVNAVSLQTATGQAIEYAISMAGDGTGLSAWQSSPSFSGLTAGTTYYVYARSASNTNYSEGTANVSAGIATAVPWQIDMIDITYWLDDISGISIERQDGTAIANNTVTVQSGGGVTFTTGGSYDSQNWTINGIDTGESGAQFTFNTAGRESGKNYIIGMKVEKGGKFYFANITIRIEL